MKTKLLSLSAIFIFGISFSAKSQQVIDQSQTVYNAGTSARNLPGYSIWQSFTAGITGTLTQIDIGFFNAINGVGTLDIYDGSGTGGTLLQTQTVNVVCASGNCLLPFTVSAPVASGNVYTFSFTPGTGIPDPYGVQAEVPGTYAGGEMAIVDPSGTSLPGFDMVFNTYVDAALGIAKNTAGENQLKLFPNPAKDNLLIAVSSAEKNSFYAIYNMAGERILSSAFSAAQVNVDISGLTGGFYFAEVRTGDKVARKRFVKE